MKYIYRGNKYTLQLLVRYLSKSKEQLKKLDEKIEKKKEKDLAKMQLEAAREIAMKGFSRYGIRDFFENKIVQASLLAVGTFIGLYFGLGLLTYSTRTLHLELIFTGTAVEGIPNFVWWIIGAAGAVAAIIYIVKFRQK